MKTLSAFLALTILLLSTSLLSHATRPDPKLSKTDKPSGQNSKEGGGGGGGGGGYDPGMGGFFGPGTGFGIPGFGNGIIGGGYGGGYGGPNGGHSKGGVIRPTVVCKEKGPCYKKKLRCPAKCFSSYSGSGKGYGGGGGGGGCTMDCKKKCIAYC